MDTLNPASPADVPPVIPKPYGPPRVWKFWGTTLWGLFIFAGDVRRAGRRHRLFRAAAGGSLDFAEAIRVIGGGMTISLSVIFGLPAVLAATWIAIRPTRTPFADYLALRWTSWRNFAFGIAALVVLVGCWDLLSRALGREVTPGFMGEVLKSAQADGALWLLVIAFCVAAPIWEEIFARGFLYRGWSESRLGVAGAIFLSSLAWTSLHLQYDWFFFGEVFHHRPAARLSALSHRLDLADDRPARHQQSGRDRSDVLACRFQLVHRSQRNRDRHRHRRQNGLQRDDLRQQRRIAAHLPRQHVGGRRGGHRRADGDDGEVGTGDAEPAAPAPPRSRASAPA